MKSKKNLLKVLSVVFVVFLLLMTLSSCKKKESEDKLAANPSALVNMNAVAQSGANSGNSIVSVPVPVNGKEMNTTVSEEIVEKPSPSEEVSMSLIKTQNKPEEKVVNVPVASQKFNSNDYSGLYDKDREYILGENDVSLEKLDIQKAVSDMKKDQILEQYQFFVRPSNEDNKTTSFLAELEDFDL